jgi:hypothetical protein
VLDFLRLRAAARADRSASWMEIIFPTVLRLLARSPNILPELSKTICQVLYKEIARRSAKYDYVGKVKCCAQFVRISKRMPFPKNSPMRYRVISLKDTATSRRIFLKIARLAGTRCKAFQEVARNPKLQRDILAMINKQPKLRHSFILELAKQPCMRGRILMLASGR